MRITFKEEFAKFLAEPTRDKFKSILNENFGEQNNFDFKQEWIEDSKLSKHILAIANSGGGAILIGIKESNEGLVATGIDKILDKSVIYKRLNKYLPDELEYEVLDFQYKGPEFGYIDNKKFQVIIVVKQDKFLPFISKRESDSLRKNAIYCRQGTNSEEASYYELQKIINKRITTEFNNSSAIELAEHISQLKALYNQLSEFHIVDSPFATLAQNIALMNLGTKVPNPNFPKESFESYILKMIDVKKAIIERELRK
jgi:predicted HTH transcriptional regulator